MTFSSDFASILKLSGETLSLNAVSQVNDEDSWSSTATTFSGVIAVGTVGEIILEAGYAMEDYITIYSAQQLTQHDHVTRLGLIYEVKTVYHYDVNGVPQYYKSTCRKLINQ